MPIPRVGMSFRKICGFGVWVSQVWPIFDLNGVSATVLVSVRAMFQSRQVQGLNMPKTRQPLTHSGRKLRSGMRLGLWRTQTIAKQTVFRQAKGYWH